MKEGTKAALSFLVWLLYFAAITFSFLGWVSAEDQLTRVEFKISFFGWLIMLNLWTRELKGS